MFSALVAKFPVRKFNTRYQLADFDTSKPLPEDQERNLAIRLNRILTRDGTIYRKELFEGVELRPGANSIIVAEDKADRDGLTVGSTVEDAFQDQSTRTVQVGTLADGYLTKPFDLVHLLRQVRSLLGDR